MSLHFLGVSYRYARGGQGVQDIDLPVAQGELMAVIGPSGSGKSTLLRLVAGLLTEYQGRIALGDRDLADVPLHQRDIGVVFQSYALFPHMTVLDNVAYGLKMRGRSSTDRAAEATRMLALVGLAEYAKRPPRELSGGQQQRVALARALAFGPRALLLDEPLAALDANIRGHLRDQIRSLQRHFSATTLFVTHDQEEALALADRVAVLDQGRLLQVDTPQQLYRAPINATVARFVGLSTLLEGHVSAQDTVDTGFAQLRADTGARTIGSAVWLLIRPEHVVPDPPVTAINRLAGRLGAVRFLGAFSRYDFVPHGSTAAILGEAPVAAQSAIAFEPEQLRVMDC
jgi:putative spermidine/putrescine transport system ATP-binding protein